MPQHIDKVGAVKATDAPVPPMMDNSGIVPMAIKSGATISKVMPGLNQSVVPLVPDPAVTTINPRDK